ncbi:cytochrome d ubiquinol oxidase subunit II [Paenibacillus sp.]|uniref:cytochrome d ubiquinol oxidase subunit II n=1 Tax=Paenibacillus sp. TaxID=58172 RepID=UPI002D2C159F|nr:cytochrome d ubiquinol oxidase subunit II [Paenibacillus sp.]HZG56525.1 cytochrome d ubiquinol oxidase subunit II [Paenibacillus sp.]
MSDAELGIFILWVFLFVYSIAGSIDFGAGFWSLVFGVRRDTKAADIANRFLSPSWKVTNVFLVLFVVAFVGFFPFATTTIGSLLVLPAGLALALLVLRSAFLVYAYSTHQYSGLLPVVSGVTGLLIPGLLVSALPLTLGGFLEQTDGVSRLLFGKLLASPTLYAHLGFGLATELFLSALFLADYSREGDDERSYRTYRNAAIALGPTTLAMAMLTSFTFVPEAQWIARNIAAEWGWFVLSVASFAIGYSALWWTDPRGRVGFARVAVLAIVAQYAFASIGYGRAHMPYLVYPVLTIHDGFTSPQMFNALLVGYALGIGVLVPVFVWFWRLFLKDKSYLRQGGGES